MELWNKHHRCQQESLSGKVGSFWGTDTWDLRRGEEIWPQADKGLWCQKEVDVSTGGAFARKKAEEVQQHRHLNERDLQVGQFFPCNDYVLI